MIFRGHQSLQPAGLVFTRCRIIDAFERGAVRAKGGGVPGDPHRLQRSRGRRGRGEKGMRVTAQMVASGQAFLRPFKSGRGFVWCLPLRQGEQTGRRRRTRLVAGGVTEVGTANRKGREAWARGLLEQGMVPMFLLLPQVKLAKRLMCGRAAGRGGLRRLCQGASWRPGARSGRSAGERARSPLPLHSGSSRRSPFGTRHPSCCAAKPSGIPGGWWSSATAGRGETPITLATRLADRAPHRGRDHHRRRHARRAQRLLVRCWWTLPPPSPPTARSVALSMGAAGQASFEDVEVQECGRGACGAVPVTLWFTVAGSPLA